MMLLPGAGLDSTLNRLIYLFNNYFLLFTIHSSVNNLLRATTNKVPHWVLEINPNPPERARQKGRGYSSTERVPRAKIGLK